MNTELAQKPKKRHPHRKDYSVKEIEKGLLAVAYYNGNTRKAEAMLAEAGMRVDHSTLHKWKTHTHAQTYERVRAEMLPKVAAQAAEEHADLASRQMDVSRQMLGRLKSKVHYIPPRELPAAIRNIDTSAAINRDKAQLLSGQPTQIVERSASEVLRALKAKGIDVPEVVDAEVVEEEASA